MPWPSPACAIGDCTCAVWRGVPCCAVKVSITRAGKYGEEGVEKYGTKWFQKVNAALAWRRA